MRKTRRGDERRDHELLVDRRAVRLDEINAGADEDGGSSVERGIDDRENAEIDLHALGSRLRSAAVGEAKAMPNMITAKPPRMARSKPTGSPGEAACGYMSARKASVP